MDTDLSRERLPAERDGMIRRLRIGTTKVYPRVSVNENGEVREVFLTIPGRSGDDVALLADALAQAVSIALQYGAPLRTFADHWIGTHGETCGPTGDPRFPFATSITDGLGKWMRATFPAQCSGASLPPPEVQP